ncbi:retrovirus-related pol polyprotein from transposon TNT 1-94 [Tanacetum coccineum]|uniref:Retrovirus-related pol polyprotein from transposon TNT 1-94 n=1 Tax=Tanacetum coccineum TaxID=301880 RepID=A0ABQ4YDF6_9ASTR
MANLKYSDKHNMVAFLKKPNESVGFTKVVDFLKGISLRYALTHNPTIYDSLVKQFWQTATVRTLANGTQQLVASIDSKEYTITEASIRRDIVPLLPAMLAGAAVDQGEGSAQPAEPHHTPVDPISSTSQPPIPSPPHPSPPPHSPPHSPLQSPPHSPPHSPHQSPPHFSPPRSYEAPLPEGNTSGSAEDSMQLKELMVLVPTLVTRINSLEKELKDTKQTLGNAVVKLVKKVKSLETALKRKSKKVLISESEGEESEDQGRKIQDIDDDPLVSLVRESMKEKSTDFVTPTKASGEAQEEEISPTILEAAKENIVQEEINTGREEINTGIEEVSTGSTKVDSMVVLASINGVIRGRKALMVEEDIQATHKIRTNETRGQEAWIGRGSKVVEAQLDEDVVKLDSFRLKMDAIKAKLEANAELTKDVLGKDLPGTIFCKQNGDMVNQEKTFVEERAKAKRNKPMTQSQLRIYMSNYLKNQGTWKLSQLKKLKFKEIKEEFNKLVQQIDTFVPINLEATKAKLKRYGEELQTKTSKKIKIMRANGADTVYMSFADMVKDFTTDDLIELYRLSDLKTIFDPPLNEDAILSLPLQQKMVSWSLQSSEDAVADDAGKMTNEEPANKGERNDGLKDLLNVQDFRAVLDNLLVQQKKGYAHSTNRDSTVSPFVSAAGQSFTNADDLPTDPLMPDLEDTSIFSGAYDDEDVGAEADLNNLETIMNVSPIPTTRINKDHPKDQIFGDINLATQTRRMTKIFEEHAMVSYIKKQRRTNHKDYQNCLFACFLSQIEPKKVTQALTNPSWIEAMQDELLQFRLQKMDVKSAFLYGTIEEEAYVCQPLSFEDPQFLDKVYKVEKALYGLHQAPKAWYETLSTYLLENRFRRGIIDKSLFIKKDKGGILLVKQKDDGIFISQDKYVANILKKFDFALMKTASTLIETNKALLRDEEAEDVDVHLYRSMIGSLMYLTTFRPDIMFVVCACARFQVTPKVSHLHAMNRIFRYLKGQPKLGLWYPRDSPFNLEAFLDSDYVGASLDRKSTTGGCQFLSKRLISWQCIKQTIVANSTTEVEYVAIANCYGQLLWIQNQMLDYGFNFMNTKIYIDNESIIYETVHKEWEDRMERAATIASILEAEHDSEAQIRFEVASNQSNDPPLSRVNTLGSGEDNMKLKELMELYTKLSERIFDIKTDRVNWLNLLLAVLVYAVRHSLTTVRHKLMLPGITSFCWIQALVDKKKVIITKTSMRSDLKLDDAEGTNCLPTATIFAELERMGLEIESLKRRVKSLEKRRKSRTPGFKRLRKVGSASRVESSNDVSLGAQDDASKQGRKIVDLDADAEGIKFEKVVEEPVVSVDTTTKSILVSAADPITTAGEVVTTASANVEIPNELTLAQTSIEIKTVKPKPVTTTAASVTSVRPRAKGNVFHDHEEQVPASIKTFSSSQSPLPQVKDKGKGKVVEPEVPLKKKDQIVLDEELALRLHAEEQAEFQKERVAQEEASKAAIIEELDRIQAMINADEQLAARLQAEEQEQFSIKEK